MKKFYLFFAIILAISISSFAQDQRKASFNESLDHKNLQLLSPFNSSVSSSTVIWQNDFSDVSDWIFSNSSVPPLDWSIETNPDLNALNGMTALPPALTPFVSTTVTNGFLFISSDATGGGDNDGTPVEATATTSNPIDLSAWPYVQLTFNHNYTKTKTHNGLLFP